jgi:hypothetical protein
MMCCVACEDALTKPRRQAWPASGLGVLPPLLCVPDGMLDAVSLAERDCAAQALATSSKIGMRGPARANPLAVLDAAYCSLQCKCCRERMWVCRNVSFARSPRKERHLASTRRILALTVM